MFISKAKDAHLRIVSTEQMKEALKKYFNIVIKGGISSTVATNLPQALLNERISGRQKQQATFHEFKGFFHLIEDVHEIHRPVYKEYDPKTLVCPFNPDSAPGGCPFFVAPPKERQSETKKKLTALQRTEQLTAKTALAKTLLDPPMGRFEMPKPPPPAKEAERSKIYKPKEDKKPGFCECCLTKYDDLHEHVQSAQHQSFAHSESHFAALDELLCRLKRPRRHLPLVGCETLSGCLIDDDGRTTRDQCLFQEVETEEGIVYVRVPDPPTQDVSSATAAVSQNQDVALNVKQIQSMLCNGQVLSLPQSGDPCSQSALKVKPGPDLKLELKLDAEEEENNPRSESTTTTSRIEGIRTTSRRRRLDRTAELSMDVRPEASSVLKPLPHPSNSTTPWTDVVVQEPKRRRLNRRPSLQSIVVAESDEEEEEKIAAMSAEKDSSLSARARSLKPVLETPAKLTRDRQQTHIVVTPKMILVQTGSVLYSGQVDETELHHLLEDPSEKTKKPSETDAPSPKYGSLTTTPVRLRRSRVLSKRTPCLKRLRPARRIVQSHGSSSSSSSNEVE